MTKILGILAASAFSLGVLAGCGSGADTATEPTPEVSVSESAGPASVVDAYCQQVSDYAAKASELAQNPTPELAEELRSMAADLQQAASELTQDSMSEPSEAERVQECTTQLQEALAG